MALFVALSKEFLTKVLPEIWPEICGVEIRQKMIVYVSRDIALRRIFLLDNDFKFWAKFLIRQISFDQNNSLKRQYNTKLLYFYITIVTSIENTVVCILDFSRNSQHPAKLYL